MKKNRFWASGTIALVAMICSSAAFAADITFTGTQAHRSASATFEVSGSDLIVTLTNTSMADALVPVDILTGVFFDISGPTLALARTSAILGPGSFVHNGPTDPGNVVGGEWAYSSGLSGAPNGTSYGISSSGLGLFGPGDRFPGNDLQPPSSVDGLQYGITSAGDNLATGNSPLTSGANALIKNQVVFTLSGLPMGFDPMTMISNVQWQYGTDLSEPHFPEPTTLSLLALGGFFAIRRKR